MEAGEEGTARQGTGWLGRKGLYLICVMGSQGLGGVEEAGIRSQGTRKYWAGGASRHGEGNSFHSV